MMRINPPIQHEVGFSSNTQRRLVRKLPSLPHSGGHSRGHQRALAEPKPASPYSIQTDTGQRTPFLVLPYEHPTKPSGALLANIRSLAQQGRFPTGKQRLPLEMTNELTHFISFRVDPREGPSHPDCAPEHRMMLKPQDRVDVHLCCYENRQDALPLIEIPLTGATLVARTCSGNGPCLYLTTSGGTFEFQCEEGTAMNYFSWESLMRSLGVRIVLPHDLFASTTNDPAVGEGMFAQVYATEHKPTGKQVVIKRVPKDKLSSLPGNLPSAVDIEVDVLRRIYHPFIVQFQCAFEDDHHYFIVLEQLKGGNVLAWLKAHHRFTESQARGAMLRVLTALIALNSKGIVHRDLKLENLVLEDPTDPTTVKLIDFGLAAYLKTPRMTMACGSPGFVAPEIIGKREYDCRADMFSTGVFLYSILSGKFPFYSDGDTGSTTLAKNERCVVSFAEPSWDSISPEAKEFVACLLQKDPARRLTPGKAMTHRWMIGQIDRFPSEFFDPARWEAEQALSPIVKQVATARQEGRQKRNNNDDHQSCRIDQGPLSQRQVPLSQLSPKASSIDLGRSPPAFNAVVTRLPLIGGPANHFAEQSRLAGDETCSIVRQITPWLDDYVRNQSPPMGSSGVRPPPAPPKLPGNPQCGVRLSRTLSAPQKWRPIDCRLSSNSLIDGNPLECPILHI